MLESSRYIADQRFNPDQIGRVLVETGGSRPGIERVGMSTVEDLEMWLGNQNPDCCNWGFAGEERNHRPRMIEL